MTRALAALPLLALFALWFIAGLGGTQSQPDPALAEVEDGSDYADRIGLGGATPGSARADELMANGASLDGLAEASGVPLGSERRSSHTDANIWSAPAEFAMPDPIR